MKKELKVYVLFVILYFIFSLLIFKCSTLLHKKALLKKYKTYLKKYEEIFVDSTIENFKTHNYSEIREVAEDIFNPPIDIFIVHFPEPMFDFALTSENNTELLKRYEKSKEKNKFIFFKFRIKDQGNFLGSIEIGILREKIFKNFNNFKKEIILSELIFGLLLILSIYLILRAKRKEGEKLLTALSNKREKSFLPLNWSQELLPFVVEINNLLKEIFEKKDKLIILNSEILKKTEEEKRILEKELEELKSLKKSILRAEEELIFSDNLLVYSRIYKDLERELKKPLKELKEEIENELLETELDRKTRTKVLKIYSSVSDILKLLDELENLVSSTVVTKGDFDLGKVLKGILSKFKKEFPDIEFNVAVEEGVKFFGNIPQITVAFNNILMNAVEELLENEIIEKKEIKVELKIIDNTIIINIEDSGSGFVDIHEAFDAFYTTKYSPGHKGLGLTLAQKIIFEHGGSIFLENKIEGGARVRIEFPLS